MHDHGTAVLDRTAEATTASTPAASARGRWLARREADLAEALATRNVYLLPVIAELVFCPEPDVCEDCQGTGYSYDGTFELCWCMSGDRPAYDLPRHERGEVLRCMGYRPDGRMDVWVPCLRCGIGPVQGGPCYRTHLICVPWEPDCPVCQDTGWAFSHIAPAGSGL